MSPPKYVESPNTVQTSLLGYDRHKKVQFQLNHLRGKPIVVMRSDTINTGSEHHQQQPAANRGGFVVGRSSAPRSPRQWVDRSNRIPVPIPSKPMYPSYTQFHHQYSCPKPIPPSLSAPTSLMHCEPPMTFTQHTAHDRNSPRRFHPPNSPLPRGSPAPVSPKLTPEDEIAVKRLFDKLAVPSTPPASSSNSSFSTNVTSDITLLELNPKIAAKTYKSMPAETVVDTSFILDSPPISSSESTRTSISDTSSASECISEAPPAVGPNHSPEPSDAPGKPKGHSCPDETQCKIFHDGKCVDEEKERKNVLQWYNDLIQWRHDVVTKRCFGPPRCHPPPMTVSIIGASRAQRANPFHRIGEVHPFAMEAMDHARRKMDARRPHRLVPADLPLPPPHEFMANAKCMEPHLFVEYCYQLTAAAYIDTGLNPPNRRPPIPPRIDPIPDLTCRESVCSSASEFSSDGEYSDDSDGTKKERLRQKIERHSKRERRLQQIFHRRQTLDEIDEEEDD